MADSTRIQQILNVRHTDMPHVFEAPVIITDMPRTFGGQIAAQTVRAAQMYYRSVGHDREDSGLNSLHSCFLNPGDPSLPIEITIDVLREGRSFTVYQASARQNGELIYSAQCSFENFCSPGITHQEDSVYVGNPDFTEDRSELTQIQQWLRGEWSDWEFAARPRSSQEKFRQQVWIKSKEEYLPEGQLLAVEKKDFTVAAIIYMTDMTLLGTVTTWHTEDLVQEASLDHSVWIYNPRSVTDWKLYESVSPIAQLGRGIALGKIYDQDGTLVAVTSQEGLTRTGKNYA